MQCYLLGAYNPVDNIVVCHFLFYGQAFFLFIFISSSYRGFPSPKE